ncbi:MAG: hypothetical protein ACPIOQ_69825, partial [Promethearchaeia archaeon]
HTTLRELSATSPIFHEVLARVAASGQELASLRVRSIYLAENASRFDQYAAAKRAFERRLGSGNSGERWLWHGTEREKVAPILANGFLRDYNKRGAYGCGVYFASQASYSLSSTYARPDDASGDQFLLLVRVLVGEACVGRASMDRPAPKPNSVALCRIGQSCIPRVCAVCAARPDVTSAHRGQGPGPGRPPELKSWGTRLS